MPQRILQRAAGGALLSGLLLALRGRQEDGDGAVPLNAISHWLWPRSAYSARGFSLRHTAMGALIHYGASCFWSVVFEGRRLVRPEAAARTGAQAVVVDAVALSAAAAWVDLVLVPPALSPGFEHRLSGRSLCMVYLGFAAGMALGELWPHHGPRRPAKAAGAPQLAWRRMGAPPAAASGLPQDSSADLRRVA